MPTTVTYTVDTGGTGDYTSLSAWEAAQQQDLVTNDRLMQVYVEASGGTADTTACTISGWTADATRYIRIEPATGQEHGGAWNDSVYRLVPALAVNGTSLQVQSDYARVTGMQVSKSGANSGYAMRTSAVGNVVERCILKSPDSVTTVFGHPTAGTDCYLRNNLMLAAANATRVENGTVTACNNTLICTAGTDRGLWRLGGTFVAKNNLLYGFSNTNTYVGTFAAGTDYNATDSTDSIGTGSNNLTSQSFSFVDAGAGNYRLTNSLAGTDLSGTFTDDIIGTVRPQGAEFDIGCFERVSNSFVFRNRSPIRALLNR